MPRLLLTTVCRPLGGPDRGPSLGVDVMKGQLCVNQGAFRTSGTGMGYGLEYIAANLVRPVTVLHWPSERELARELRRHEYADVGLSFNFQLVPDMRRTVALIRRHAPKARVILGGYGTAAPECASDGDLVCTGDGISFCRELFGERVGEPIEHPTLVYGNSVFSLPIRAGRKVVVCTGLGCAQGCDFCATSARFRKYVPFVEDGDDLFRVMDGLHQRTGADEFQIFDENFLVHEQRARRFGELCETSGRHFDIFTFSSMAALSRYTAEDLCRIGVSALWIGLEGKHAGYEKLQGERLSALCERLRRFGILVCGSMIVGFDYQTPEIVREELEENLNAAPTYLQCLLYGPTPGTALWERIEREGRWLGGPPGQGGVPYGRSDGFEMGFRHPHMSPAEMQTLQNHCYERDLSRLGPSIYRAIATWFQGWSTLRTSSVPFLAARARVYERKLRASRPLLQVGIRNAAGDGIRDGLRVLKRELRQAFGPPSPRERALEHLLLPAAFHATRLRLSLGLFDEPSLGRSVHREPT